MADENLLPLLAPLSLFAAHGIFTLRRGARPRSTVRALTFAVFAVGVWLGYIAMLTGLPGPVARNFARIAPGYVTHVHVLAILFALLLAAAWVYLVLYTAPSPLRSVTRWAAAWCCCGHVHGAVDAVGRLPEELPLVALQLKSKLPVARRASPSAISRVAGGRARLPCGIRAQPYDVSSPARVRWCSSRAAAARARRACGRRPALAQAG